MGYLGKEVVISNVIPQLVLNSDKMVPLLVRLLGALLAFIIDNNATQITPSGFVKDRIQKLSTFEFNENKPK